MTEVAHVRCEACSADLGTIGLHGFDPVSRSGELLVACLPCGALFVGRFEDGDWLDEMCPKCLGSLVLADGKCPRCRAPGLAFEDPTSAVVHHVPSGASTLGVPAASDPTRLTLERLNARQPTCRRCGSDFHVELPADDVSYAEIARLLAKKERNRASFAIKHSTSCDLRAAKEIVSHATTVTGRCGACDAAMPIATRRHPVADCPSCGSLHVYFEPLDGG